MRFVPIPGVGVPTRAVPILDPVNNLAAWLDRAFNKFSQRWLHTGSLYNKTHDPEGLLSTLPAIATTLIGCLAGLWLQRIGPRRQRAKGRLSGAGAGAELESQSLAHGVGQITPAYLLNGLILAGLPCLVAGLLWNFTFPINKNLWTSSYVLFAAGLSLLLLALCYWLIDIRGLDRSRAGHAMLFPWLVFGSNAITAFVLSNFLVELALWIKVPAGALVDSAHPSRPISSWQWIYLHLFARHGSTCVTSLAFAVAFVALCFLPNWLLWRRRIFLKI
jgi:predicted acyltransferase